MLKYLSDPMSKCSYFLTVSTLLAVGFRERITCPFRGVIQFASVTLMDHLLLDFVAVELDRQLSTLLRDDALEDALKEVADIIEAEARREGEQGRA